MSNKRYLLIDTETGGLDPLKHSLLTGYIAIVNPETLTVEEDYEFKNLDEVWRVSSEALKVNKIDLQQLSMDAKKTEVLNWQIFKWLSDHIRNNEYVFHPLGQNYQFDLGFFQANLPDVMSCINRRGVDTSCKALEAQLDGLLPPTLKLSLESLATHFNLPPGEFHSAKFDALTTLEVYKCLKKLT